MAIPGHRAPKVARAVDTYTAGGGRRRTPATSAVTANIPFIGPTQLIGVGFAPFTIPIYGRTGKVTVGFANLPNGSGSLAQVLTQSGVLTAVRSNYTLLLVTTLQGYNSLNGTISTSPQAVDRQGVIAPGPTFGARSFRAFQAVVTYSHHTGAVPPTVSGTVLGHLLLANR